jgi:hypothetical protein
MKHFLLVVIFIMTIGFAQKASAQACTLSDVNVHLNSVTPSGGNCVVNITLTFSLQHNNGNKYIWMHLWKDVDYPGLGYAKPPTATELALSLANIGINNNVTPAVLLTSYTPASTVPVQSGADGLTISITPAGAADIYTITGIKLTVTGGCTSKVSVKGDVWSTQSASQNNVQCFSTGLVFIANDPKISGFKRCSVPRTLSLGISTVSTDDVHVSYTLYKDDGDGILEPGSADVKVGGDGPFTINSTTSYSNNSVTYTGSNIPGDNASIWVVVTSDEAGSSPVNSLFENGCTTLPVKLTYFNAKRSSDSRVDLSWQTAQELNSKGFEIQRQTGSSAWDVVGFVNSEAMDGNSNSSLNYTYADNNNSKGITQYRLRTVDLDGNSKFSDIRAVRGQGQSGKTIVYPNPSSDGSVKVMFEDFKGTLDITLMDINGRVVKQWSSVTSNNITIEKMTPGYYTLRTIVRETGNQSVDRIIVTGH